MSIFGFDIRHLDRFSAANASTDKREKRAAVWSNGQSQNAQFRDKRNERFVDPANSVRSTFPRTKRKIWSLEIRVAMTRFG